MAALMATIGGLIAKAGIGTVLQVAGAGISGIAAVAGGAAQKASAEFQAQQLDAAAKTENAVAQRAAIEDRRQSNLAMSRARAVAAASGGGQDIPLLGDIAEDGEGRVLTTLWEGEEAAKGRRTQAAASRFEGRQAGRAGVLRGVSTILSSAGQTFSERFG